MIRSHPIRTSRRHTQRPQAIRRAVPRTRRYQLLDALVLVLIALAVLYLAGPVGATELPAEAVSGAPEPAPLAAAADPMPIEPQLEVAATPPPPIITATRVSTAPQAEPHPQRLTLYDLAAAQYGLSPNLLRALHQVETSAAADGCHANLQGSSARGPLQFMPATFRAYGVDGDGDGRPNICSFADSLFSAARYLKVLGATPDPASYSTRRALARYGTNVSAVLALAS